MAQRGSFGRNWNLIKVSRNWKPHGIAEEILRNVLDEGDPEVRDAILAAAGKLGGREAEQFLDRTPEGMDATAILESYFLISGIPCEVEKGDDRSTLYVKKECGLLSENVSCNRALAGAYLAGFIRAVAKNAAIMEVQDHIRIELAQEEKT